MGNFSVAGSDVRQPAEATLKLASCPSRGLREGVSDHTWTMANPSLITIDPEILGGTLVFTGTRVPVKTLFDYLEDNYSLDEFLECFPTVSREMAHGVLEQSKNALLQPA